MCANKNGIVAREIEREADFWEQHPELHALDLKQIRVGMMSSRNPSTSALRLWVYSADES